MTDAYLRHPSLHGDTVAFVADDDVWLGPAGGGRAWRLTADSAPAADTRLSPDGATVAWTSRRDGTPEVHAVPVDGGSSRRLTYWGNDNTRVRGWTPDGRVLALSTTGEPFRSRSWAHAVPLDGGPPERLPYGPVVEVGYGPGSAVALATGLHIDPAWWKRYRGGTARRLWVDRTGGGTFERLLPELDGQLTAPMWVGGRLAFLSDHEGVGNVYSCAPDGTDLRRHTDSDPFYVRGATTDGRRVVYSCAGRLELLDSLDPGASARPIDLTLAGPRSGRSEIVVDATEQLGEVAPDRTGRASAVEVRGTVHWATHRDGPAVALSVAPGVRARLPRVLGDSGLVVWVTDAEGEDALEVAPADGSAAGAAPRRLGSGQLGRVLDLAAAPDAKSVALASHDGRVLVVDVDSGALRTVATTDQGDCDGLAFSPDSAWLAWSQPGPEPLRQIRIARLDDLTVLDATPLRFTDTEPQFTADGTLLAFLSVRTLDPVYDAVVFDLAFPAACRPHVLPLSATTPSPFDPQVGGRPVGAVPGGTHEDTPDVRVKVDPEGIAERVVPVPVPAGTYRGLAAVDGGLVWLREEVAGTLGEARATPQSAPAKPRLERFDLRAGRCDVLAEDVDSVRATADGTRLLVRDASGLRVVPSDRPVKPDDPGHDRIDVDLSRVRVSVDPVAERRQMFEEAGRLMRDCFWVADMAGMDWEAVLADYRPLLDAVSTADDLHDLLWEVQGELGTSHAYVQPRPFRPDAPGRVGLLGADLAPDDAGLWRVVTVLPGESSAVQARSPLAAPGAGVRPGDAVLAVDGHPVDPVRGPAPLLVGSAGKPVEFLVRPAGEGEDRRVVVVPLADEQPLRYQAWVADRRAHVHRLSDGALGYLHVPDMMGAGWAQLHRDLRVEMRRDGLVVDVRDNRGGHTSQLVIEKFARRAIGWSVSRGHAPDTYPQDAPRGPVVLVTNEHAGSDGDIVTAAVKAREIGPVVGLRTWGGVVGIDMRFRLVDGTGVTQPRYAFWFGDHGRLGDVGFGVENHGVDPDVEVPYPPQDWVAGVDPQLDEAVRIAVEMLGEHPAVRPPETATRPSRARIPLPPRAG